MESRIASRRRQIPGKPPGLSSRQPEFIMEEIQMFMKNLLSRAAVLLLVALFIAGCSSSSSPSNLIYLDSFEGGAVYRTNGEGGSGTFKVLVLNGSWREMGRQYGYLMRHDFAEFYEIAVAHLIGRGMSLEHIESDANDFYNGKMDYAKALIDGMAETSGLTLTQQRIASAAMIMIVMHGCSSLNAWGDYTGGGPLVVGRNWDIGAHVNPFNRFMNVTIYNPAGGWIPVADVSYLGFFFFQTGMNKSGIFFDLQNGEMSDPGTGAVLLDGNDTLFTFLATASTLAEMDERFLTTPTDGGVIMNAADAIEASVYEYATSGVRIRSGNGLLASSNHFIDPAWGLPLPPEGMAGFYSKERLANLLQLGEVHKGGINVDVMKQIFGTTISQGGPTWDDGRTSHQVIAVPAQKTLWVKATGYSGWERIQLATLFK